MKANIDQQVLQRVRAEFLEMPGMALRVEQVRRLCGVELAQCQQVLDALVATGFLRIGPDDRYRRWTTGDRVALPPLDINKPATPIRARRG